ncbi:MAG: hypothetical protein OCC49_10095 [Fibrobacterales bacterium]
MTQSRINNLSIKMKTIIGFGVPVLAIVLVTLFTFYSFDEKLAK